mgnify:CR=1 FL=1
MINNFLLVLKFSSTFQDSMETNGMQLLRLCVHLLIVVGTDISSVRQSGKVNPFLIYYFIYFLPEELTI